VACRGNLAAACFAILIFENAAEADRLNYMQVPEEVDEGQDQRRHRTRRPRLSNSPVDTRRKDRRCQKLAENDLAPYLRGLVTQQDYLNRFDEIFSGNYGPGPEIFSTGYQPEPAPQSFGIGYIGLSAGHSSNQPALGYSVRYSKRAGLEAQGIPRPREQQPTADYGYRISPLTGSRASLDHRD
jgi:hypothetical protein